MFKSFFSYLFFVSLCFYGYQSTANAATNCTGKVQEVYIASNDSSKNSLGWGGIATLYVDMLIGSTVYKIGLCGLDGQLVSKVTTPQNRCDTLRSIALVALASKRDLVVHHTGSSNCSSVNYITRVGVK